MKTNLWLGLPLLAGIFGLLACNARADESGGSLFDQARLEGRALANSIVSQKPIEGNTLIGKLTIRPSSGKRTEIPIKFQTLVTATNWQNLYLMHDMVRNRAALLTVIHAPPKPNVFVLATVAGTGGSEEVTQ